MFSETKDKNWISKVFRRSLSSRPSEKEWVESHVFLLGDVHNHSGISYGHGSLEKAIAFAVSQLDFFSVTGHFAWPDMNKDGMAIPDDVKEYHKEGFRKLRKVWNDYLLKMKASEASGIVPFVSYEYHSFDYGDYTVIAKSPDEKLPPDPEGEDSRLSELLATNIPEESGLLPVPHHIGYKEGYRGISWSRYNQKASPLVEIVTMHGSAESDNAFPAYLHTMGPRSEGNTMQGGPYLHTMGPRSDGNTMQGGLAKGFVFGVVGNTDHHSSSPGSYGSGRTGLWAEEKTREGIWQALLSRNTTALTGEGIEAALFVDGQPAGSIAEVTDQADLDLYIVARSKLSRVDVIQDGEILFSESVFPMKESDTRFFDFSVGWGEQNQAAEWDIRISAEGADIIDIQPRFRGELIVDPLSVSDGKESVPSVVMEGDVIHMSVSTNGNPTPVSDCTQGLSFSLRTSGEYRLIVDATLTYSRGKYRVEREYDPASLKAGTTTEYMNGFVSPSFLLSREMDLSERLMILSGLLMMKRLRQPSGQAAMRHT